VLSCILAEIHYSDRHLGFLTSGSVTDSTIETFNPENMVLAVGIVFIASLEAEIPLEVVLPPSSTYEG